ncbi:DUF58 domain-containing protein [Paenibacillus sp. y28]|uniref:DUF58 domain-containing protein n=1 Tax=Paenibacillus sp. y28 TaxID=3129110 RepID=UPI003017BDEC
MISGVRIVREQRPRQTVRFWAVLVCFVASTLFLLFQGGKLAALVFTVVSILCAYLLLGRWSGISRTSGTRGLQDSQGGQVQSIQAGDHVTVQLEITIPGFWPIPYVFVKDRLVRQGGGEVLFHTSLVPDWRRRGQISYETPPLLRGMYYFDRAECVTEDVFGLFEHKGELVLDSPFRVQPQRIAIREWPQLQRHAHGSRHHSSMATTHRETTQINGVREYIYGDRLSRVHWNATAKTGTWKSKEFEKESLPRTIVVLDRDEKAYSSREQYELAVSVAASLFEFAAQKDWNIGLLSAGNQVFSMEARRGKGMLNEVLHHLTEAEPDGKFGLLEVMKEEQLRFFTPGSFLIVVSPRQGQPLLQAFNWLYYRQINACHLWTQAAGQQTEGGAETAGEARWRAELNRQGHTGYAVQRLQDLPGVLRGRSG